MAAHTSHTLSDGCTITVVSIPTTDLAGRIYVEYRLEQRDELGRFAGYLAMGTRAFVEQAFVRYATFDAIVELVRRRNLAIVERDREFNPRRADQSAAYFRWVGEVDGLSQALEALRDAGEPVASAEYLLRPASEVTS